VYDVRTRYLEDSVATGGPARLLTMLYDRLELDVHRGVEALRSGDRPSGTQQLAHAQEIVSELMGSLDQGAWAGGPRLMSIYGYLFTELSDASAQGDADRAAACLRIVEPLSAAWREAAASLSRAPVVPTQRDGSGGGALLAEG